MEVLRKLGFGSRWRDLLCGLLSSSSSQVLLNGIPGDFIQHRRGLRQGDPLSPMLFILVMDVLNWLVTRAAEAGLLKPLSRRPIQHRISLYADDVALFIQPSASDMSLWYSVAGVECAEGNAEAAGIGEESAGRNARSGRAPDCLRHRRGQVPRP